MIRHWIIYAIAPSAETSSDESGLTARGFKLLKNGRFGYSKAYLDELVAMAGAQYRILM